VPLTCSNITKPSHLFFGSGLFLRNIYFVPRVTVIMFHHKPCTAMMIQNPCSFPITHRLVGTLCMSDTQVVQMIKSCPASKMPPHIYSKAQEAYNLMLAMNRDQSIVFMGHSGSGKSTSVRHCLSYYAQAYGGKNCNILRKFIKLMEWWN